MSTNALILALYIAQLRRAQKLYDLKGVHHYLTQTRHLSARLIAGNP